MNRGTVKTNFYFGKYCNFFRDFHIGDLDEDSKDGELDMLNTDLMELQVLEAEVHARREEAAQKWHDGQTKRQQERMFAEKYVH